MSKPPHLEVDLPNPSKTPRDEARLQTQFGKTRPLATIHSRSRPGHRRDGQRPRPRSFAMAGSPRLPGPAGKRTPSGRLWRVRSECSGRRWRVTKGARRRWPVLPKACACSHHIFRRSLPPMRRSCRGWRRSISAWRKPSTSRRTRRCSRRWPQSSRGCKRRLQPGRRTNRHRRLEPPATDRALISELRLGLGLTVILRPVTSAAGSIPARAFETIQLGCFDFARFGLSLDARASGRAVRRSSSASAMVWRSGARVWRCSR